VQHEVYGIEWNVRMRLRKEMPPLNFDERIELGESICSYLSKQPEKLMNS
jgi:hypothetical protein